MTNYTISGKGTLPDRTTALSSGAWYIGLPSGYALNEGEGFSAGVEKAVLSDSDGSASVTLPETTGDDYYTAYFLGRDKSTGASIRLPSSGVYQFTLTADATWDDVMETPTVPPLTPSMVTQAQTAADTATAALAEFENQVPGTELAYAESSTIFTSTATSGAGASSLSALTVSFTGSGRPVDVEFYCCEARHSVAGTKVSVLLQVNAALTGSSNQLGQVYSASTTVGNSINIRRRFMTTAGTSYTITPTVWGGAAGTTTLVAAAYEPLSLSVTSR